MFQKFSKYLLIGVSALVLLAAAQQGLFNKNSNSVLAENTTPIEVPPPPPPPDCPLTPTLNECTGCNKANTVSIDCNGNRIKTGETKDSACSGTAWGCIAPAPTCTVNEVIGTTHHCAGQQLCTFNIHHRADCSSYEGGAYGCQNSAQCGFVAPPAPAPAQVTQQQQQVNECPRSDFEDGHPQRCVNGRFVQCFCDSQGCTWQHDNGACGGTTTTTTPVPPAPICRSINCPAAPSGCAFTGQILNTCSYVVTLTCGTLTCNQIPPAVGGVTNNNTNSNTNNNTNTVTVNNPTPQVVLASVPTTLANVGVGTSVISPAALPKTGLPALVWTALAFIPAGLKMRSFSQVKKALENKASFIWEDRQFRNGS